MWVRVAGGKTMTSHRAPLAGFGGVFGDAPLTMAVFQPTVPPLWRAGYDGIGPPGMTRPVAAGRHSGYGPPYEMFPGPRPREDMGPWARLHPYPNHPWAGLGALSAPSPAPGAGSWLLLAAVGLGAFLLGRRSRSAGPSYDSGTYHGWMDAVGELESQKGTKHGKGFTKCAGWLRTRT